MYVKEKSIQLLKQGLKSKNIHPAILDLYGGKIQIEKNFLGGIYESFETKEYLVNLEMVNKQFDSEFIEFWKFIKQSFLKVNGNFGLIPSNWDFNDSFSEHIFIQLLASVSKSMRVIVNLNTNKISSIMIN